MNRPLVSVVMVVRNVDRFLTESIESILGQTFRDFEFIIADFGSTDNSKAIVSRYAATDDRIKVRDIPDCSLVEARNAACSLAQGQYIAVMDADDASLPDRLEREIEFLENHPKIGLVGGAAQWINAQGEPMWVLRFPAEPHEISSALLRHCPFCHASILMRREAFEVVGGYRVAFRVGHDYDLYLRIAEHFECANLKQTLVRYRIHPHQVSLGKRKQQTLSILAAQVSASRRKDGDPDLLSTVNEITPALLMELGVSEAKQHVALAADCRDWVRNVCVAREYSVALAMLTEILRSSDLKYAEAWQIADLWLTAASLHRKEKEFLASLPAVARAIMARPAIMGRPVKRLLARLASLNGVRLASAKATNVANAGQCEKS